MKIVCAKFRHLRPWEREALERVLAAKDNPKATSAASVNGLNGTGPKYTSTGPSLAGEVNVNVASETESFDAAASPSAGKVVDRIKHIKNAFLEDMNNPYQASSSATATPGPPRRPSLPALVGLLGTSASIISSLNLTVPSPAMSSVAVHSVYSGSGASGLGTGTITGATSNPSIGPLKFIGGLFGPKDKTTTNPDGAAADKEERKREEKERKAREKEQKALEKEKKRRKEEKETGDKDDAGATSGALGWGPTSSSSGKLREKESMDTAAMLLLPPAISAALSSLTLLPGHQTDEEQPKEEVARSIVSTEMGTALNDEQQDDTRLASSLPNLRDVQCPPPPHHPTQIDAIDH